MIFPLQVRSTQGVRLIRLADDELVATVAKVEKEDDEEDIEVETEGETSIDEVEENTTEDSNK